MVIDYSKWDQLSDSSDEESEPLPRPPQRRLPRRQIPSIPRNVTHFHKLDPKDLPQLDKAAVKAASSFGYDGKLDLLPDIAYSINPLEPDDRFGLPVESNLDPNWKGPEGWTSENDSDVIDEGDSMCLPLPGGRLLRPCHGTYGKIAAFTLEQIEKNAEQALPFTKKYYTLHIRLKCILQPIWRRVRVPGGTSLAMLHDKVICPVVGWARNYHAYIYTLPTSRYVRGSKPDNRKHDVGFGPVESQAIDMCHAMARRGAMAMVDDAKVCVADLLKRPGEYLKYLYDFGDYWQHLITVENIQDALKPGEKAFQVLGGARACPPEDSGNMHGYLNALNIVEHGNDFQEFLEKAYVLDAAVNNKHRRVHIDPERFDIEETQLAMEEALKSKLSRMDDSKMTYIPNPEFKGRQGGRRYPDMRRCNFCKVSQQEKKKTKEVLKRCARCSNVLYCTSACQDWKMHKRVCIDVAALNKPTA